MIRAGLALLLALAGCGARAGLELDSRASGGASGAPVATGGASHGAGGKLDAGAAGSAQEGLRLVVGGATSCVVTREGAVKCWGFNFSGQLGLGDAQHRGDDPFEMGRELPFVELGAKRRARRVVIGGLFSCALLDDRALKCWGRNSEGQLGLGDTRNRGDRPGQMGDHLPAVDLGRGRYAVDVALGDYHACALLDQGSVKCWGKNGLGELGLGDTKTRGDQPGEMGDNLPELELGTGRRATLLGAGKSHTCAVLDDGSVKCWGFNGYLQLGLGDANDRGDAPGEMGDRLPSVAILAGRRVAALGLGNGRSCALLDDGAVICWGADSGGRLVALGGALPLGRGRRATRIAIGAFHGCAQLDDATVTCWGTNDHGQLGAGDALSRDYPDGTPTLSLGELAVTDVVANGGFHTCALLEGDRVKCWGSNFEGELGLGDHEHRGDEPGEMGDALPFVELGL